MANIIGIMGESGSGKTISMRNLDPKTTYYIDCDKKGLSWRGWKKQYNSEAKNYYCTDKQNDVLKIMQGINTDRPHTKTIVIDTLNGIMVADEMRRSKEKGYDKWMDMAVSMDQKNMMIWSGIFFDGYKPTLKNEMEAKEDGN